MKTSCPPGTGDDGPPQGGAESIKHFAQVQRKVSVALMYLALSAGAGVLIIISFMTYMLPKFQSIFEGMNVQFPASMQFLIEVSNFFSNPFYLEIMGLLILVSAGWLLRFRATKVGRRALHHWQLRVPLIGQVLKLNLLGLFARTLATELNNGVPVLTALKITERVIPNVMLKEAIARTCEGGTGGQTIAHRLAGSTMFPQLMIDRIKLGEDMGDVPGALQKVASWYENELNIRLRVMTNLIVPALIVAIGGFIGFLLFSVLSAMTHITANISR